MNHRVPDFEMEEDYSIPAAARKSILPDDDIMELLWQNGQVVMQSLNQRPGQKKSSAPDNTTAQPQPQQPENQPHLFIQEDEMVSWLQYHLGDEDPFGYNLLYTSSSNNPPLISAPPPKPPIHPPPPRRTELQNFLHFSKLNDTTSNFRPPPKSVVKETTVVESSVTPLRVMNSRPEASNNNASLDISMSGGGRGVAAIATAAKDAVTTCEMSLTSSPGRLSGSGSLRAEQMSSMKPPPHPPRKVEDRKRKGGEVADDSECRSEDVTFEPAKAKKQIRGSGLTKRSRAAEAHNLSERRHRDRINEKMKALQELIPRCNKMDKASMLDEAIEYLKSLQLQLQMMSMGCGMVPMMFPGVQQYMPMGMGMGMGMEMGMNQPMMPFANVLAGSAMPRAAAAPHMGPRFPIPPFQMHTMLPNDPNRVQATNQSEHISSSLVTQNQNQSQVQNFADPYQQYLTPQQMQMQMQLQQNQAMDQPSCSRLSSSMGPEIQESPQ